MNNGYTEEVIDDCSVSEWYTAQVFAKLFPNEYRYDGLRRWSYWDGQEWKRDANNANIKARLRYDLSTKILQRAKFWQDKVATKNVQDMHTAGLMIQRLLNISQKLQTDIFLRKILRELQEYYCG